MHWLDQKCKPNSKMERSTCSPSSQIKNCNQNIILCNVVSQFLFTWYFRLFWIFKNNLYNIRNKENKIYHFSPLSSSFLCAIWIFLNQRTWGFCSHHTFIVYPDNFFSLRIQAFLFSFVLEFDYATIESILYPLAAFSITQK